MATDPRRPRGRDKLGAAPPAHAGGHPASADPAPGSGRRERAGVPGSAPGTQPQPALGGASAGATAPGGGMTPVFPEHFLFDDELEAADDSTFVRKYNLSGDDDEFPMLLRQDNNALSAFSSALDLAPLSQTHPRQHRPGAQSFAARAGHHALSPWSADPGARTPGAKPLSVSELADSAASLNLHEPGFATQSMSGGTPFAPSMAPLQGANGFAGVSGGSMPLAPGSRPASVHEAPAGFMPLLSAAPGAGAVPSTSPQLPAEGPAPDGRFPRFPRGKDGEARKPRHISDDDGHAPFARSSSGSGSSGSGGALRRGDVDLGATRLEELRGELPQLCRDQYGCRFLQKKLEENVPTQRDLIFLETFGVFPELMTDPFGNYLCQKLLEHCTDAQRDQIVQAIAPDLVGISLNMHGTRAVQKTIDFLSTPSQTRTIISALAPEVVTLIKDLNGNHVIQKCLHRLNAEENQFVYDAVAAKCVEVATHRHGCCVLQRCIDHASEPQRLQLVQQITHHALQLVQDPFGNYVVQYVLDLKDRHFTHAVTQQFLGHVCMLSVQKFSSNVIEKCIRVSPPPMRTQLIAELVDEARLESLLRDSFANYVVQTSLDYAEPTQRAQLVECIRPVLPLIRSTPYGKRIQSKLAGEPGEPRNAPPLGQGARRGGRAFSGRGRGVRNGSAAYDAGHYNAAAEPPLAPLFPTPRPLGSYGFGAADSVADVPPFVPRFGAPRPPNGPW